MEVRMRRPIARAEKSCPPAVPPVKRAALGWLRGIVLVAMMASAGRAAADDALARLHARGTLRWGGDMQGGEPYVFQDPGDRRRLAGFEVEIADALARRLEVRAEFAQNDWQTLIPSLERGDFDVALKGVEEPYLDLERGRLRAVLLDNIIAGRYALPRATLRAVGTVGEGVYAIAVRPDEPELLRAVDGALAAVMSDGELRRILERWHLWDARQATLAGAAAPSAEAAAAAGALAYL